MDKFLEQPFSHHAFLFIGDRRVLAEKAKDVLIASNSNNFEIEENNFDNFKIEDARQLKEGLSLKPKDQKERLVFVSFGGANPESLQTLLKTVEEPGEGTRLMFFVDPQVSLPETFLSRFVIHREVNIDDSFEDKAKNFLKSNLESRLKIIETMDANSKKSKEENQFKNDAIHLTDTLEKIMYENLKKGNVTSEVMKKFLELKDFLRDRGAMTKMILESIAINLPILK